eukprot:2189540-Amphidinium_carterae.1
MLHNCPMELATYGTNRSVHEEEHVGRTTDAQISVKISKFRPVFGPNLVGTYVVIVRSLWECEL